MDALPLDPPFDAADMLQGLGEALVVLDAQGRLRYANAEAARVLGIEPAGAIGQAVDALLPAAAPALDDARRRLAGTGSAARFEFPGAAGLRIEGRAVAAGDAVVLLMTQAAVRGADPVLGQWAHDLRNLLSPLANAIELMRRPVAAEAKDRALVIMQRQVDRLRTMAEALNALARGEAPAAPPAVTPAAAIPTAAEPSRVLVVDDQELVRESLGELLRAHGHDVRTAAGGVLAIEIAAAWRPHFVLIDIHMPGLSGLETASRLRAQYTPAQMTLLMLSGIGINAAWQEQARLAGFDDCIDKSADPEGLVARLRDRPGTL